ncbi:MAG: 2-amino-4-ketopentanoate thiolase [Tissierellia bacterium]|nr:2-amino-4-ketopentanoate thiolase [Tissierellia bacterium]
MSAKKGDWVRIHGIVLKSSERTANIPEDTKKVDLEMWNKGFLLNDSAKIGDEVEVETVIGRKVKGTLIEVNHQYELNYGRLIPELLHIGIQAREILKECE